jgi:hypothetical protein
MEKIDYLERISERLIEGEMIQKPEVLLIDYPNLCLSYDFIYNLLAFCFIDFLGKVKYSIFEEVCPRLFL